ncbi:hypothetical protein ACIBQ5_35735 [Streptomyces massasporeus]|uniref:hypothetical protein n=1 Tax=Streptomyces massasporeus TaxID=67324 RepID=UPI00379199FC
MSSIAPYLAPNLAESTAFQKRNEESARRAFERLAATAWTPLAGYPGSDVHWLVRCELCGWEGLMFYSHMRRDKVRHRGCLPTVERPAAIAAWIARQAEETGKATEAADEERIEAAVDEGEARGAEADVETGPPRTALGADPQHADDPDVRAAIDVLTAAGYTPATVPAGFEDEEEPNPAATGFYVRPRGHGRVDVYHLVNGQNVTETRDYWPQVKEYRRLFRGAEGWTCAKLPGRSATVFRDAAASAA